MSHGMRDAPGPPTPGRPRPLLRTEALHAPLPTLQGWIPFCPSCIYFMHLSLEYLWSLCDESRVGRYALQHPWVRWLHLGGESYSEWPQFIVTALKMHILLIQRQVVQGWSSLLCFPNAISGSLPPFMFSSLPPEMNNMMVYMHVFLLANFVYLWLIL